MARRPAAGARPRGCLRSVRLQNLFRRGGLAASLGLFAPVAARAQTRATVTVVNVAHAVGHDAAGLPIAAVSQAVTPVEIVAQVQLSPGQSGRVRPGGSADYVHTVRNLGNYPESFALALAGGRGWSADLFSADGPTSAPVTRVGPLAPGDSTRVLVRVRCPIGASPGDEEVTTITARAERLPGEVRSVEDRTRAAEPEIDPLRLGVEPQGSVPPGARLLYRLEIGNPDPQEPLADVVLEDVLPEGLAEILRYTSGDVLDTAVPGRTVAVGAAYDVATRTLTWRAAALPPGFRGELHLEVRVAPAVTEGTRIRNRISARAAGLPATLSNVVETPVVPPVLQLGVTALVGTAEPGDAVLYALVVTNTSRTSALAGLAVDFRLPAGFRFLGHGSSVNAEPLPNMPEGAGAVTLAADTLAPLATCRWTLACAVSERAGGGTRLASAVARATIFGDVTQSAAASAAVRIAGGPALAGTILGRVYVDEDSSGTPGEQEGLPNVRLLLEDGTQSMTDARGRFHIESVRPGLHVLRLDEKELPSDLRFASGGRLAAGSERTRFVDVGPGEVRKVNFGARRAPGRSGPRYKIAIGGETWSFYDFSLFAAASAELSPAAARLLADLARGEVAPPGDLASTRVAPSTPAPATGPPSEDTAPAMNGPWSLSAQRDSISVRIEAAGDVALGPQEASRRRAIERALGAARANLPLGREDAAPAPPAPPLEERVRFMTPESAILEPADGTLARGDRVAVLVKVPLGATPCLRVNDRAVSDDLVGMRLQAPAESLACYRFVGVPLQVGDNRIVLAARRDSVVTGEVTVHVQRSGGAASIELHAETTPADGRSEPLVQVLVHDRAGWPVAEALFVTVEAEGGIVDEDADPRRDGHQVRLRDGHATLHLVPAASAGERRLRVRCGDLQAETSVRLQPAPRDWLVAGMGEVSLAARPATQPLTPDEARAGADARAGLYAQGRVGEQGQLTLGLDTRRQRDALFGEPDAEHLFPALGDAAAHGAAAPSSLPLFARLDLPAGHAELGDFRTGWNDVELGRFDRALTGFDGAWLAAGGRARVQGFAASTRQNAARDEIPGRGISGPYQLQRRPVIATSERAVIETRDRYHSERVVLARPLVRHADYDIDYANGTLLLKEPVPSADAAWNPIFLVVEYETLEDRAEQPIYGLRATASPARSLRAGVQAVRSEAAAGARTLVGGDAHWALRPDLGLSCEYARTEGFAAGDALGVMLQGRLGQAQSARLYYRDIGAGFQNPSRAGEAEIGKRKYGLDARVALGARGRLALDAYAEDDLRRGSARRALTADCQQERGPWTGALGYRLVDGRDVAGTRLASVLAARARRQVWQRLGLEAGYQQALGEALATDPTRASLGADLRLTSRLGLRLRQEWDASDIGRSATLLGLESRLGEQTALTSSYERVEGQADGRASMHVGLRTTVPLGGGWSVSGAAQRGRVIAGTTDDSGALSLGAEWRQPRELLSMQYEGLYGAPVRQHALRFGGSLRLGQDWTLVGRERWLGARGGGVRAGNDLLVAWAYRPVRRDDLQWLVGLRSLVNAAPSGVPGVSASRTVLSCEGSADIRRGWTLIGGLGARFAAVSASAASARAVTTLTHLRLVYEPAPRFDLSAGLRNRARSGAAGDWSYGLESGYRVMTDVWAVAGYNFAGFADPDLPAAERSGQAGYVSLRFKFDERLLARP